VAEVIEAIDGPLTMTACSEGDDSCDQYAHCNIRDPLWRIKDRILEALATCSIQEMASESVPVTPGGSVPVRVLTAPPKSGG